MAGMDDIRVRVWTSESVEAMGTAACQLLRYLRSARVAETLERATNPANAANLRDYEDRLIAELRKAGFAP
jgi:uncharacterized protein Smg (DUF494 family)